MNSVFSVTKYILLIFFIVTIDGCTSISKPVETKTTSLYYIPAETWEAIDKEIYRASVAARKESTIYSLNAMDNWRRQVSYHTMNIFIPWFSSFWTQEGLATRVAWYKLQYSEGEVTPEELVANYLQEEFYEQVLEPVKKIIDPSTVRKVATTTYLRELNYRLNQLPQKYQIPAEELMHHLKFIPAIVVNTIPIQEISLYEILQSSEFFTLPVYKNLLAQNNEINGNSDSIPSKDSLDRVANRAVSKIVDQLEVRSSAAIASLLVGGYTGIIISVGSATWSITEHADDKTDMESQLRNNLDAMLKEMWQNMVIDKHTGVTSIVHHMSNQIEYAVFTLNLEGTGLF